MAREGFHHRQWICVFVFTVFIFHPFLITSPTCEAEGFGDYPPPIERDWMIHNDTRVSNETMVINGDINITANGTLTLNNVTLIINSSLSDIYGIYVGEGGTLNVFNSNITSLVGSFTFEVYGNMTIEYSKLSHILEGIEIYYGDVQIANSTIFSNFANGLICHGDPVIYNNMLFNNLNSALISHGSPIISNNTLYSNRVGVAAYYGSSPLLFNNSITDNENGVVSLAWSSTIIIGNTISNNTSDGVTAEMGHHELHYNTIISNGGFGIKSDHGTINATNNHIYDNERWGIYSLGALIFQENNTFEKDGKNNQEGNVLQEWEFYIEIFDAENEKVENVNLTVYDIQGDMTWTGDTIGNFRAVILKEYEILNNGSVVVYTPYEIVAVKGTTSNSTFVDVINNEFTAFILDYGHEDDGEDATSPAPSVWDSAALWIVLIAMVSLIVIVLALLVQRRRKLVD